MLAFRPTKKLLILVLIVVVVGLLAVALRPTPAPDADIGSPSAPPASEGPVPSALWIGDSYTEGFGASSPRARGYACPVSHSFGWTCSLDAQGGTGYINNGRTNVETYAPLKDRLPRLRSKFLADVIIVDAGRNDDLLPPTRVVAAASRYLKALRKLWPRAEIVVISPYFMRSTSAPSGYYRQMARSLAPIVASIDGRLIDPIARGWIPPPNPGKLVSPDGIHPNNAGYRYLRDQLKKELRRLGLAKVKITDKRGPAFE